MLVRVGLGCCGDLAPDPGRAGTGIFHYEVLILFVISTCILLLLGEGIFQNGQISDFLPDIHVPIPTLLLDKMRRFP